MFSLIQAKNEENLEKAVFAAISRDLEQIKKNQDFKKQVLLVVPAQFTLKAEELAFKTLGAEGFLNFHILSGNKLLQEIIRETGAPSLTPINTIGRSMLLRRITKEKQGELVCYKKQLSSPEFLKMAGDFILQLKQNELDSSSVEEMIENQKEGLLKQKLLDLLVITKGYEEAMHGKHTDSEDMLSIVNSKIKDSSFVSNSKIYYYGFYSFTKKDLTFLKELALYSQGITLALQKGNGSYKDKEIFFAPEKTAAMIKLLCEENAIPFSAQIEKDEEINPKEISAFNCATSYTEGETIAIKITELLRGKEYQPAEIAVLTNNSANDIKTLKRIFESYGLPIFCDEKRTLAHLPLARLITALLDIANNGYKKDSVLKFIKTQLLDMPGDLEDYVFEFENYMRLYHLHGEKFAKPIKYGKEKLGDELFARLEEYRCYLYDLLNEFVSKFNDAKLVKEKSQVLYNFLAEKLGLIDILKNKAIDFADMGIVDGAEETAQSWNAACEILDQMVELLGEKEMDSKEYALCFADALFDVKIGVLPQSEGRIQLGTVSRSKLAEIKVLFIAGFNEGKIPEDKENSSILSDRELTNLENLGYSVSKAATILFSEEKLLAWNAMHQNLDKLYLSTYQSTADGENEKPSPMLLDELRQKKIAFLNDAENSGKEDCFIQGKNPTIKKLAEKLRNAKDKEGSIDAIDPLWKESYNQLLKKGATSEIKEALLYEGDSKKLKDATAKNLFTPLEKEMSLSPSRLERFAECPFKHFIHYGLRPREEESFEIDSRIIGDVHHEVLLRLSEKLTQPAIDKGLPINDPTSPWMIITEDELSSTLDEIISYVAENMYDKILKAGPEEDYRALRIKNTSMDFAKKMVEQVRSGNTKIMFFEKEFGIGKEFPAIDIDTNLGKCHIEGRIDRIDLIETEDGNLVKIVDYKSGSTSFDKKKIEKGLSLQLMSYLEGALGKGDNPAGVFYFNIKEPSADATIADFEAENLPEKVLKEIEKAYEMDGLAIDSPEATSGMTGKKIRTTSKEEFEEFRKVFNSNLHSICKSLAEGDIHPSEKALGKNITSCTYCDYKSICLFGLEK